MAKKRGASTSAAKKATKSTKTTKNAQVKVARAASSPAKGRQASRSKSASKAQTKVTKAKKITKKSQKKVRTKPQKPQKALKATSKSAPKPAKPTKVAKQPKTPKVTTPKLSSIPKGYTADEYEKYKQEKQRLAKLGNAELKAMLKKNLQSMSGNKHELVQKIADGIVLGRIPRCPHCFGGRPKYNYKNGTYNCPGYRDDVDYKNCHSIFTKQQLKRDPWEA